IYQAPLLRLADAEEGRSGHDRSQARPESSRLDGGARQPLSVERRHRRAHVQDDAAWSAADDRSVVAADDEGAEVRGEAHISAVLWGGGRQLSRGRLEGGGTGTSRLVPQHPGWPGGRSSGRGQEDAGPGADCRGGGADAAIPAVLPAAARRPADLRRPPPTPERETGDERSRLAPPPARRPSRGGPTPPPARSALTAEPPRPAPPAGRTRRGSPTANCA